MASFYIYQRVWVRNLITEVEALGKKNEIAQKRLAILKSEWMLASSISKIEATVDSLHLGLKPTSPSQNLALRPQSGWRNSRYAGLIEALKKLKGGIPLVSPNEADAKELFEAE
jgi:hypothetical protein